MCEVHSTGTRAQFYTFFQELGKKFNAAIKEFEMTYLHAETLTISENEKLGWSNEIWNLHSALSAISECVASKPLVEFIDRYFEEGIHCSGTCLLLSC